MVIILDHGAFEPALPDMADTAMCFVEAPSMGHGERLQDAADVLLAVRRQQEMEMIVQQGIAIKSERVAFLGLPQSLQKRGKIGVRAEYCLAVVSAVQRVVHQTIRNQAQGPLPCQDLNRKRASPQ